MPARLWTCGYNAVSSIPPFSCICTPRYYADKSLLNPPKIRLF